MTDRADKVNRLINQETKDIQSINQKILDCDCTVDCSSHKFARNQIDTIGKLMDEIQRLRMDAIDAKFYLSDIELLRKAIVDGVLNGIDSETYNNIQRIAKTDAETGKNTNNRSGGIRLS
jgi:hypothetical protein